jgi:hypothetical protein
MINSETSTAIHLRERAAYYRSLARQAMSDGIAREFYSMAEEYEEDAERLAPAEEILRRRQASNRRWR